MNRIIIYIFSLILKYYMCTLSNLYSIETNYILESFTYYQET